VKPRPFLQGGGVATLYILPVAIHFLNLSLNEAYHHPHPISSVPLAMLAVTLLVWLVSWMAFLAIEHLPERGRNLASIALAVLFLGLLIRLVRSSHYSAFTSLALHVLYCLVALVPIALFVSLQVRRGFFAHCATAITLLYCIAGFGSLVLLPRLAVNAFRREPREQTSFDRGSLPAPHLNSRIVWILMDELSYDQTFEHRSSDLSLPNFDAFASQSISFSDLQPIGIYTELVVPGLLLGAPARELHTPFHGQVSFRPASGGAWQPMDQQKTIFGEAWKLGWNPGIAGWYNPYCRIFPDVLARCSWQFSDSIPNVELPLSYDKSVMDNMLVLMPLRTDIELILRRKLEESSHRRDYDDVMKNAEDLLRDRRIHFAFLHMPVPHPPGIYDRTRHQICSHGDYLDNLALADDTLGKLMKILRSTQDDQQTTVIVSSDHSWRTIWWKPGPSWSDEEERVSKGGKFDDRPVLMVHLPGANTGELISKRVSALVVHDILENLLRGQIHNTADLDSLLDRRSQKIENAQFGN
jgi:Sulfatase